MIDTTPIDLNRDEQERVQNLALELSLNNQLGSAPFLLAWIALGDFRYVQKVARKVLRDAFRDYSNERGPIQYRESNPWWGRPLEPRWIPTVHEMRHWAYYGGSIPTFEEPTFTDDQPWCDL